MHRSSEYFNAAAMAMQFHIQTNNDLYNNKHTYCTLSHTTLTQITSAHTGQHLLVRIAVFEYTWICKAGHRLIVKYAKMIVKCEKEKLYSGVFRVTFFTFHTPFFIFRSISCQGRHVRQKSKDFVVYFFAALIKHEIRMKFESV